LYYFKSNSENRAGVFSPNNTDPLKRINHSACGNTAQSEKSSNLSTYTNNLELSPKSARRVDIANQIMSLKPSTFDNEPIMSEYTKITLLEDWNSRDVENFPKFWTMSDNTEGVFFCMSGILHATSLDQSL